MAEEIEADDFDLSLEFSKNLKKKKKKKIDLEELMAEERKENEANDNGKYIHVNDGDKARAYMLA